MLKIALLGFIVLSSVSSFAAQDIDRQTVETVQKLETLTESAFSHEDKQALQDQLSKMNQTLRTGTTLACASATLGMFLGGNVYLCYDWDHQATYIIGGGDLGLVMGASAGLGVIHVQHDEKDGIEGQYVCLDGGAAKGFIGGSGLLCLSNGGKYLVSGSWNAGLMYKAGPGIIGVQRIK